MTDTTSDKRNFLLPGEMAFVREPTLLSTLLGSCVAVCIYDRARGWGGMNHFMVPSAGTTRLSPGKCGDQAIPQLLKLASLAGCDPGRMAARIYGGAAVTGALGGANHEIGDHNVALARKFLKEAGVTIGAEEVGGVRGRRIDFDTGQGAIKCSLMAVSESAQRRADLAVRPTKVLVVDDSATVRRVLCAAIAGDPTLTVCGEAEDPFQAREQILATAPDVLCLDVIMPKMDGLAFLKKLMQFQPIPTIIVSTVAKQGSDLAQKLSEAGAVAVLDKEQLAIHEGLDKARAILLPLLKKAAHSRRPAPQGIPS
jgi:two-component system, chemotaxis family, protein-glutamate methylesterase/glutaminase